MADATLDFEVVVVGAGPAGIAAATVAAEAGHRVALVESAPWVGGQIWRDSASGSIPRIGRLWLNRLQACGVRVFNEATVIDSPQIGRLRIERTDRILDLNWEKLVLAVGARELFIPFPGWTLPNVFGAGGLQLLVKGGWPVAGKRIAVAGSGPLLFAVAAKLRACGAQVPLIAEQSDFGKLLRFGLALPWMSPSKLVQAAAYKAKLLGVPYRSGCWPLEAHGDLELECVTFRSGTKTWTEDCDGLACAFGLVPNTELPQLLGCALQQGFVKVDAWQKTSVNGVYCAGEPTGIGGVDRALVEGQIAGFTTVRQRNRARRLFGRRAKAHRFSRVLEQTFAPRAELRTLATPETIICRCEDVTLKEIVPFDQWRAAKLQTRCGMGSCQGRTCGSATQFLLGWKNDSIRPPLFPARIDSLVQRYRQSTLP